MAEVDVKKQRDSEKGTSIQKHEGSGISRRGSKGFPSPTSKHRTVPAETISAEPKNQK